MDKLTVSMRIKEEKLIEILKLCYEISNCSNADVFFDYHPHVNYIHVYFYENGWKESEDFKIIEICEKITYEMLDKIIGELRDLYKRKIGEIEDDRLCNKK